MFVPNMKPILISLLLSSVALLPAQEPPKETPAAELGKELFQQMLGYWTVDFDSAVTKSFLSASVADNAAEAEKEEMKKEMAACTFEIKEMVMTAFDASTASPAKISIKSHDLEKRIILADFQSDAGDPIAMTLHIDGDRLTLGVKADEGKDRTFELKRIDKQAFETRVSEALRNGKPVAGQGDKAIETKDGYPVAIPVPDKPGFVFSPYNNKVVDVRELPSGTLVMDPHFAGSEKKIFRVP